MKKPAQIINYQKIKKPAAAPRSVSEGWFFSRRFKNDPPQPETPHSLL
jgi:hypothetical protein